MRLYVFPEFDLAVSIEVQFSIKNDLCRTLRGRHAAPEGKHVAPEDGIVYHFNDKDGRKMVSWKDIVVATDSLFDSTVVPFNFRDMSIACSDVELGMWVCKVSTHRFKLIVGKDDSNSKTTSGVCSNNSLEVFDYVGVFHAVQFTS